MSQTLDIIVFRALYVSCKRVFLWCIIQLKSVVNVAKTCFVSVFVGWHFSGGSSILLALHQIPLQPDQLSPKCLADHPTGRTTAGNVQTAIPIRKMDACVSPEDVSNARYNCVSSTVCVLYTSILWYIIQLESVGKWHKNVFRERISLRFKHVWWQGNNVL